MGTPTAARGLPAEVNRSTAVAAGPDRSDRTDVSPLWDGEVVAKAVTKAQAALPEGSCETAV
jgi:hypothetical protein